MSVSALWANTIRNTFIVEQVNFIVSYSKGEYAPLNQGDSGRGCQKGQPI